MKYFYDTEFIDSGKTIDLISIGIVSEDGREYYAESVECDHSRACDWVKTNVIAKLTGPRKSRSKIAEEVKLFCGSKPEFWAYYAAYDWLCLCQLYGRMLDVPEDWPNFTHDLQSLRCLMGVREQPPQPDGSEHNALSDARWNRDFYAYLKEQRD